MALLARILPDFGSFDARIASVTQRAIVVTNETRIRQLFGAQLTAEALWMPTSLHGLDDTSNYDVAALVAEWRVENSEISLAILATFKFVENPVLELTEALSATEMNGVIRVIPELPREDLHKALDVPQLAVRINDLLLRFETLVTTSTRHRFQAHVAASGYSETSQFSITKVNRIFFERSLACKKVLSDLQALARN